MATKAVETRFARHFDTWMVEGDPSVIVIGAEVEVSKKDGSISRVRITKSAGWTTRGRARVAVAEFQNLDPKPEAAQKPATGVSPQKRGCRACAKARAEGYLRQHLFDGCEECGDEADW